MPRSLRLALFVCTISLPPISTLAQTPAPAPATPFALPLTTGEKAWAVLLPAQPPALYLVAADSKGSLILYTLTPNIQPGPIPPTPTPGRLTIAIVEDPLLTTPAQRQVLTDKKWRDPAAKLHDFRGILPSDLIQKGTGKPPADLAPFLDAAQGRPLPWTQLYDDAARPLDAATLPSSTPALIDWINAHTTTPIPK